MYDNEDLTFLMEERGCSRDVAYEALDMAGGDPDEALSYIDSGNGCITA